MPKHYQGLLNGRSLMQPFSPGKSTVGKDYESIFGEKKLNIMSDKDREKCSIDSSLSQWDIIKNRDLGGKDIQEKYKN